MKYFCRLNKQNSKQFFEGRKANNVLKFLIQICMGLTEEEEPIFVLEDGTVLIYSLFGTFKSSFSMGQEAKDMKILSAR